MDPQLHMLQVPAPILLPLPVRGAGAGPHGLMVLPIQGMNGRVQALDGHGGFQVQAPVLEGVPLPDAQVVGGRPRRGILAGTGAGGGLVSALFFVMGVFFC